MKNRAETKLNLESKVSPFFERHHRKIVYGIILAMIAMVFLSRLASNRASKSELEYFEIEDKIVRLENRQASKESKEESDKLLQEILATLKERPELRAKYRGRLAQTLLLLGDVKQAEELTKESQKVLSAFSPQFYLNFTQNSLLISKTEYQQALTNSLELKKSIEKKMEERETEESSSFFKTGELIFGMNLLRIAILQEQLNLFLEAKATWQEFLVWQPKHLHAYQKMVASFQENGISLHEYIQACQTLSEEASQN